MLSVLDRDRDDASSITPAADQLDRRNGCHSNRV
jgi:hypothetical protein